MNIVSCLFEKKEGEFFLSLLNGRPTHFERQLARLFKKQNMKSLFELYWFCKRTSEVTTQCYDLYAVTIFTAKPYHH